MARCKARVRIKADGTKVEIVERYHNHGILTERRKKGVLKALYNEKRKFNSASFSWQIHWHKKNGEIKYKIRQSWLFHFRYYCIRSLHGMNHDLHCEWGHRFHLAWFRLFVFSYRGRWRHRIQIRPKRRTKVVREWTRIRKTLDKQSCIALAMRAPPPEVSWNVLRWDVVINCERSIDVAGVEPGSIRHWTDWE